MPTIFSVFFEGPFWVAVLEQSDHQSFRVARYVFGSEPSDVEIYAFVQSEYLHLTEQLSDPVGIAQPISKKINPKRQQRLVQQQMQSPGYSSKAQEALRLQREQHKRQRISQNKCEREQLEAYKHERKDAKRKQKRRGH